jgi:SAM-dependent methyltransferase
MTDRIREKMSELHRGSSALARQVCNVVFPLQRMIAGLISAGLSSGAQLDRQLRAWNGVIPGQSDPIYQEFLRQEIEYWRNPAHGDEDSLVDNDEHPQRSQQLREYYNRIVTGSPQLTKLEMLRRRGPFEHALALGHLPGLEAMVASGLARKWTFNSITGRFIGAMTGQDNVTFINEDLNFASLAENRYDLIVCDGVLHHLVHLDSLVAQVNRALTSNGIFFVNEYIGEERFRWRNEKRSYVNTLLAELPLNCLAHKFTSVDVIHFARLSPFEAVTSTQIPSLLDAHLTPVEKVRKGYGVLFPALLFLKPRYLTTDNAIVARLIEADEDSLAHGVLPAALSGIFGKKQ